MNSLDAILGNAVPKRLLHAMLRVGDLERSLAFYTGALGMKLLRREEYPSGRFTLAFVGYGEESASPVIELTCNWDRDQYEHGSAFGHIAVEVADIHVACARLHDMGVCVPRQPGLMTHSSVQRNEPQVIAFALDPDGYQIELVQAKQ